VRAGVIEILKDGKKEDIPVVLKMLAADQADLLEHAPSRVG
jgi:hypothetical protein